MKAQTANSLITSQIDPQRALKIPIAHGEGNYFADADVLKSLNDNDQVLFRYCDEFGNITAESNPNGSLDNIAGICNLERNVFGFMPHPERASDSLVLTKMGWLFLNQYCQWLKSDARLKSLYFKVSIANSANNCQMSFSRYIGLSYLFE